MMKQLLLLLITVIICNLAISQSNSLLEKDSLTIASLKKGKIMLGLGAYLTDDTRRNEDDIIYYIIDERENDINFKLQMGYFSDDYKVTGIGFQYRRNNNHYLYTTLLGDTVKYDELTNNFRIDVFRKYYSPIFGSKRVYLITQPEISYAHSKADRFRADLSGDIHSSSYSNTISAGFQVGFLVFPMSGFAIEGRVGPLGIGYNWEFFDQEGNNTINKESFFIHLQPRWYLINFLFTSYF